MCSKKGYKTELDAKIALVSCYYAQRIKNKHKRHERRIYLCPECGLWHLTSMEEYNGIN